MKDKILLGAVFSVLIGALILLSHWLYHDLTCKDISEKHRLERHTFIVTDTTGTIFRH